MAAKTSSTLVQAAERSSVETSGLAAEDTTVDVGATITDLAFSSLSYP